MRMIVSIALLFSFMLLFSAQLAIAGNGGIIVEDAESVWVTTSKSSKALSAVAGVVSPRVVVEYADCMIKVETQEPSGLCGAVGTVAPRIIVEYAEAMMSFGLGRPLFAPPTVRNLTASQRLGSCIVDIGFEVYDARSSVIVEFQFWNGSGWSDCVTTTGEGRVNVGAVKGAWNAKADFNNRYVKDMRIRVVVDNGKPINNIAFSVTPPFVLDTKPPLADAGVDQKCYMGEAVTLNGSGSWDESGIADYTWTFKDKGEVKVLKGANPSYTFSTAGTYTISLNVTDPFGNWASDTVTITVLSTQSDSEPPKIVDVERDPLAPQPNQEVHVKASVTDEGSGVGAAELHYRVNGGTWKTITMNNVGGLWEAIIPGQAEGANVEYYVKAFDRSGNAAVSPTYSFAVSSQSQPGPISISVYLTPANPTTENTVTFTIDVKSDLYILTVQLEVDGEVVKTWTEGPSLIKSKSYTYTGGPYSQGRHSYKVYVMDMGGRTEDTGIKYFDVSSPSTATWWAWIAILAAIGIIIAVAAWLRKRKRRPNTS